MPFHDLNVIYNGDRRETSHTLSFHQTLNYTCIAIAVVITSKIPPTLPTLPIDELKHDHSSLKILTRLTLTVSDTSQNHRLPSLQPHFDIIALRPTDEKSLQLCCTSLECDLISLDLSQRLYYNVKFSTVSAALQRGIRFEICYSPGIVGANDARRNLISGATALIRATRGRGIIISSEAMSALGVRAPWDVINLAQIWGLSQERGKEAVCEEAGKVVRLAGIKRTSYRGVVDIIDGGANPEVEANTLATDKKATEVKGKRFGSDNKAANTLNSASFKKLQTAQGELNEAVVVSHETHAASSAKRKASNSSLSPHVQSETKSANPVHESIAAMANQEEPSNKPLSNREMKRRAKKARLGDQSVNARNT